MHSTEESLLADVMTENDVPYEIDWLVPPDTVRNFSLQYGYGFANQKHGILTRFEVKFYLIHFDILAFLW